MSPLNEEEGRRRPNCLQGHGSSRRTSVQPVGLRLILAQLSHSESNHQLVLKSACRLRLPTPPSPHTCFLKSCHLCNKNLTPDKDIYMRYIFHNFYFFEIISIIHLFSFSWVFISTSSCSGDEGFCSIECRNIQIVMDEKKEIEASTKKMVASFQHCRSAGGCETCALLEDLRRRRKPISRHKNQAVVS